MTRKDWVRLPETGQRGELRMQARVLDVTVEIDRPDELLARLEKLFPQLNKALQGNISGFVSLLILD